MGSPGVALRWVFCAAAALASHAATAADVLSAEAGPADDVRFYLATREVPPYVDRDSRGAAVWSSLQSFYRRRDYRLAWMGGGHPSPVADSVAGIVAGAEDEGIGPIAPTPPADATPAVQDVRLTYSILRYAVELSGRFDPKSAGPFWLTPWTPRDVVPWLEAALATGRVVEAISTLSPEAPAYGALRDALRRYHEIQDQGGWPLLPARLALRRGSRGPQVALLRARLAAERYLASPAGSDTLEYDAGLAEAVKSFEARHGLRADGVLDAETVAALNVPVEERIRQIELNLERWRWRRGGGGRSVVVNLPSFQLTAQEEDEGEGRRSLTMKVVIGKPDNPTPVLSSEITTVVFSPYWNVPSTIAADEIIPAVRRDPGYLRRHGLELVRGTQVVGRAALRGGDVQVRQRPGAGNALGLVKFVFPNLFNVYLHDTPEDGLFARPSRAFSHGCIRVERPFELARWVLDGLPQWTPVAVNAAMRSGRERHLALPEPIPVEVTYMTAEAAEDGTVSFWPDVYGHDRVQMPLLPAAGTP